MGGQQTHVARHHEHRSEAEKNEQSAATMDNMMFFTLLETGSCWTSATTTIKTTTRKRLGCRLSINTPSDDDNDRLVSTQGHVEGTDVSKRPY
jgi:hypothetical protein